MSVHLGALQAGNFDAGYTLEPAGQRHREEGSARRIEAGVIATYLLGRKDAQAFAAGTRSRGKFIAERPAWPSASRSHRHGREGRVKARSSARSYLVQAMNVAARLAAYRARWRASCWSRTSRRRTWPTSRSSSTSASYQGKVVGRRWSRPVMRECLPAHAATNQASAALVRARHAHHDPRADQALRRDAVYDGFDLDIPQRQDHLGVRAERLRQVAR